MTHAVRPLTERIAYDVSNSTLFVNFEGLEVGFDDVREIETTVTERLLPLRGRRASVVVNHDHFSIRQELIEPCASMVLRLETKFYANVTRDGAAGFLKARSSAPA